MSTAMGLHSWAVVGAGKVPNLQIPFQGSSRHCGFWGCVGGGKDSLTWDGCPLHSSSLVFVPRELLGTPWAVAASAVTNLPE